MSRSRSYQAVLSRCVALCLATILLSGCVATYKAVGVFDQYNEVLLGDVNHNLLTGGGNFTLVGKVTGLRCAGNAVLVQSGMTCNGQWGEFFANCSDGRTVSGRWNATSCKTGFGRGKDNFGSAFAFTFGHSETEAIAKIESAMQITASRPELPTYKPKEERKEKGYSTGTGFFVSKDGLVLTNFHVIEDADEIYVVTLDGSSLSASLVSEDRESDLALIRISDASQQGSFEALVLGSSTLLRRASEVMTLGFPLVTIQGQAQKASFGRVNALSGVEDNPLYLQVDVPIQPGNSGGPLFDESGFVVGIVTATLNQVNVYKAAGQLPQNVSYAVKSDYALPMLEFQGVQGHSGPTPQDQEFEDLIPQVEAAVVLVVTK